MFERARTSFYLLTANLCERKIKIVCDEEAAEQCQAANEANRTETKTKFVFLDCDRPFII